MIEYQVNRSTTFWVTRLPSCKRGAILQKLRRDEKRASILRLQVIAFHG